MTRISLFSFIHKDYLNNPEINCVYLTHAHAVVAYGYKTALLGCVFVPFVILPGLLPTAATSSATCAPGCTCIE